MKTLSDLWRLCVSFHSTQGKIHFCLWLHLSTKAVLTRCLCLSTWWSINLGGLRMGFTPDDVRYDVSETEYRVPTNSWHWMSLIGVNLLGPVGLDLGLDLGLNNVERNIIDPSDPFNWYSKKKTYFSIAPLVGVNVWIFNVFAGYEFVFGFKDIQGWIFGAGLSLPVRTY